MKPGQLTKIDFKDIKARAERLAKENTHSFGQAKLRGL
jgi:hypothetical protein